ncbi:hypothetical protein QBL02_13420 [Leucobacter sp. UT-8R-CII-1-4]|uniref:primosomal protein N' family DNA-binding protein n=1 Tax=Leucobacter sp. UT-8R-CII-1-4 TaxID=3040075 RepID=UPI0024A98785|nr:hypothetical protein [Leucobacter sp. UT-8R-CII-1-4]MDI6024538.1 hypothetical protein [Leucobacter sp. UT-8R-CII-1-4]
MGAVETAHTDLSDRAEAAQGRPVAQVLLDSALPQLDHLFDYAVPADLADDLRVGQRVRVPFRSQNRRSHGYVVGFAERSDFGGELQPIADIVGPVPALTPQLWRVARAVADRAGGSASDILRLALPQRMVRAEKQHLAGTAADPGADDLAPEVAEQEAETAKLLLNGDRLAITSSHGPERLSTGEWVGGWAVQLAKLALAVHAEGRSAILVAPDYRDVDQLADALASLGHSGVVRVDSRQSGSARYASFLRALDAKPRIVLGNRSAIYAPAYRLGAILLWDDGDPLLSEPLAPYVHARDAALVRASIEHAESAAAVDTGVTNADQQGDDSAVDRVGLVFAAHARSAEVQRLIDINYVKAESVPPRRTRIITADAVQNLEADFGRVPEFAARSIREGLSKGPVLVQVAVPGYAPVAVCDDCGERARCKSCGGPIGFQGMHRAVCRWCGEHASAWRCPECNSARLAQRGAGSERTVEQFQKQFPGTRVILSDGAHPHERVDSRPALVVATRGAEPIAAGGYHAVVLLDADRLLSIESLRAAEDCMRWWQNAAALAAPDGRCVLASGSGPVVQAFVTGRIDEWLRSELRDRHQLRYPPAVRVASVTGGRQQVDRALKALGQLPGVDTLGPTPVQERPGPNGQRGAALLRAIVRFDYAQGAEVAKRLRGALVADAAGSSSRVAGRAPGRAHPEALRLRFDDRGVFDS